MSNHLQLCSARQSVWPLAGIDPIRQGVISTLYSRATLQVAAAQVVPALVGIQPEKSTSRPRRHLGVKRPNAEVRPLTPPFEELCGGLAQTPAVCVARCPEGTG